MKKITLVSPRQKKSQQTWDSILKATVKLIKQYNYDSLTVRNICDAAGVSTGTFYHHFTSKENLLTYYLTDDFLAYAHDRFVAISDSAESNPCDKAIAVYVCCAEYAEIKGVEFISGFYSTRNKSLLPPGNNKDPENVSAFTPIFERTMAYFEQGQKEGLIAGTRSPYEISFDMCMLFNGLVYGWCISGATLELPPLVRRIHGMYLNNVVTETFVSSCGTY